MAKPMVITLPCALLLLDLWPLRRVQGLTCDFKSDLNPAWNFVGRPWWELLLEKIPLFLLSAASGWLTILAQTRNGGMASLQAYPLRVRIANSILSYALYLYKTFWPHPLAVFYPPPGSALPAWKVVVSLAVLSAITIVVVRGW